MNDGTKMEFHYDGFAENGEVKGNQAGARKVALKFKFDSYVTIDNELKIVGVEEINGAIQVFDADKCRVVLPIDEKASRDALLG